MTPESGVRVAKIRARLDASVQGSPLPWFLAANGFTVRDDNMLNVAECAQRPDAEFIAHAPGDVTFLLAEVERLSAVVDSVQALCADWRKSLDENSQIMTTAQRNAHLNDLAELSFVLPPTAEETR